MFIISSYSLLIIIINSWKYLLLFIINKSFRLLYEFTTFIESTMNTQTHYLTLEIPDSLYSTHRLFEPLLHEVVLADQFPDIAVL